MDPKQNSAKRSCERPNLVLPTASKKNHSVRNNKERESPSSNKMIKIDMNLVFAQRARLSIDSHRN